MIKYNDKVNGGRPTLNAKTRYRIDSTDKGLKVLKRKNGDWQKLMLSSRVILLKWF